MPVETATYVADLNANNPVASDGLAQADDHVRLIKSVLKTTFPNLTGVVTATQTQLNVLAALTYPLIASDLAANSVTTAKILDANVTTAKILDANVTTAKLATNAVTTVKITDANVTTAKLADGAVTAAKIASLSNARLLGNNAGSAAAPSEIALGSGLAFSGATTLVSTVFAQTGQLTKSGANLLLSPYNGNQLVINSVVQLIPDAGVTLAPTGSAGTLYYIYAFMSGATMTLEASTTLPVFQPGTGVGVKTGDVSRTFVGMAYPTAGPAWTDSATQRFVRSWFNDPGIALLNKFTANRAGPGALAEIHSEIRIEFLSWFGETVLLAASGAVTTTTTSGGVTAQTAIGIDGGTAEDPGSTVGCTIGGGGTLNVTGDIGITLPKIGLAQGYHYATLLGTTGTWFGSASAGQRCTLTAFAK